MRVILQVAVVEISWNRIGNHESVVQPRKLQTPGSYCSVEEYPNRGRTNRHYNGSGRRSLRGQLAFAQ
jgi:hypothetical protein